MRLPMLTLVCASMVAPIFADEPSTGGTVQLTRCQVKFQERLTLAADRSGTVGALNAQEGERVRAGQIVAGLRDAAARAAVSIAREEAENDVDIRYARKAAELAFTEYQIALETNRRAAGAISQKDIQRLKLAYERSLLQIEQAEYQLRVSRHRREAADAELQAHRIVAPIDGVVRRVFKKPGEAVAQGEAVLELVAPDRVRVEGFAEADDAVRIRTGDRVEIRLCDRNGHTDENKAPCGRGHVIFVDLEVQPLSGKVAVWAELENRDGRLQAGSMANLRVCCGDAVNVADSQPLSGSPAEVQGVQRRP